MKRINILHITDFHFGSQSDVTSGKSKREIVGGDFVEEIKDFDIRNRFLVFMRRQALTDPIDVIAFTGDLGMGAKTNTIVLGIEYLDQLAKDIGVSPSHVLLSPGNHDLDRKSSDDKELDEFCRLCQEKSFSFAGRNNPGVVNDLGPSIVVVNSCLGGTQHALYGGLSKKYWALAKKSMKKLENEYESEIINDTDAKESEYQFQCMDIPALGYDQIDKIADELAKSSGNCIILLMHHNVLPASVADIRPFANLIDSGQLIVRLMEKGRRVVLLHGHIHCDSELTIFPIREDAEGGFVASIGSRGLLNRTNAAANLVELWLTDTNDFIQATVDFVERIGDDFQYRNQYVLMNRHRETGDIDNVELTLRNKLEMNKKYVFTKVAELLNRPPDNDLAEKLIQLQPKPINIMGKKQHFSDWQIIRVQ